METRPKTPLVIAEEPAPAWSARFGLRHMMFGIVVIALGLAAHAQFGWSIFFLLLLLVPPTLAAAIAATVADRAAAQRDALLAMLATAARRGMPLGPAVAAFADLCGGPYRRQVLILAERLDLGAPLPEALAGLPGVVSDEAAAVARAGWDAGALPAALAEAVAARATRRDVDPRPARELLYPMLVLVTLAGVGFYLLVSVTPMFGAMFRDFGVGLPEPTRTLVWAAAEFFGRGAGRPRNVLGGLSFPWTYWESMRHGLAAAAFVAIGAMVVVALLCGLAWVAVGAPIARRLLMRREAAIVLRALAAGVESGRPLDEVLVRLSRSEPRRWFRKRLIRTREDLARGRAWVEALRAGGLIRAADAAVLAAAGRAGNLAWALRETADAAERRLAYRLRAWGLVLQPVVLAGLGALVLLFGFAYFQPLAVLIHELARATG